MPVHFKLKHNGQTRRVTFQERPVWDALAPKLQAVYDIPLHKLGVSYLDDDDDEITVSSNEELQDFYHSSTASRGAFKLNVLDLSLVRDPSMELLDPDWHPITNLNVFTPKMQGSGGPHAFVEIVNSDASLLDNISEDGHSTVQGPSTDKGNPKASSFGAASVTSLVAEEAAQKYPIHVRDHSSARPNQSAKLPKHPAVPSSQPFQSTPKVQARAVDHMEDASRPDDPPLPTFEGHPTVASVSPNLYHDLASMFNTLSQVFSSHPELSEGVRNIVHKTTTGEYWRAHREFLSEKTEGLVQTSEAEAGRIEAEAARRISVALGHFFHFFAPQGVPPTEERDAPSSLLANTMQFSSDLGHLSHMPRTWPHHWHGVPPAGTRGPHLSTRPVHPPPRHEPWWFGPPPPLNHHHHHHRPIPPCFPLRPPPPPGIPPPPPPPPPPPFMMGAETGPVPTHQSGFLDLNHSFDGRSACASESESHAQQQDTTSPSMVAGGSTPRLPTSSSEELRAKLEEAKRAYKAQKEAYRQERRRRERSSVRNEPEVLQSSTSGPSREPIDMQFPNSLGPGPRRANTLPGHGFRWLDRTSEDLNTRALNRITKQLADMGFTETSHPALPGKIAALIPISDNITKKREDDIVTALLEELIPTSSNGASGSHRSRPPGAWS